MAVKPIYYHFRWSDVGNRFWSTAHMHTSRPISKHITDWILHFWTYSIKTDSTCHEQANNKHSHSLGDSCIIYAYMSKNRPHLFIITFQPLPLFLLFVHWLRFNFVPVFEIDRKKIYATNRNQNLFLNFWPRIFVTIKFQRYKTVYLYYALPSHLLIRSGLFQTIRWNDL